MSITKTSSADIEIKISDATLFGILEIPENAKALVIFAHGAGSSRFSKRNQHVAGILREKELATLLMDLLTPDEEKIDLMTAKLRFDIDLLANRVVEVIDWAKQQQSTRDLPVCLFGASTGAAAALIAAAKRPTEVKAVVSRGGRPDLAKEFLPMVKSPTLLIVGGDDEIVIGMNEEAAQQLETQHELTIIPGATHLFEEPGKLDEVARLTKEWFAKNIL